ncbi:MAG TPA: hypothetical protein VF868_16840 [Bacteroidia bacterium]|jgi:hypothetical protein
MKKKSTDKVIEQLPNFKLPDNARKVIFLREVKIKPDRKLQITIAKATIGYAFHIGSVRVLYFKGLNCLIVEPDPANYALAREFHFEIFTDATFYNDGRKKYKLYNRYNWLSAFPEKEDNATALNAARDLYVLTNAEYCSLTPPEFEAAFKSTLLYCESMEFYEICAKLMAFASDWFAFYERKFEKEPLLKLSQGWGWLYFMHRKDRTEMLLKKNFANMVA